MSSEPEQKTILNYTAVSIHGGEPKQVAVELPADTEEAQDKALHTVFDAEWNLETADILVQDPSIQLADGSTVSWQEFTAPALKRAQEAALAARQ